MFLWLYNVVQILTQNNISIIIIITVIFMYKYPSYEIVMIFNIWSFFLGNGHDEFITITVVEKKEK